MISNPNNVKYIVLDVDGTMTDAGIYYDESGNELKKFCTRDAAAFFAAYKAGIKIVVLTGRRCKATERRMKEMKVPYLFQDIKDKRTFLEDFMRDNNINKEEIAYIGDDLNDLAPMKMVGIRACPADSCAEIKTICNYVSIIEGGKGAVRDIFENYILHNKWHEIIISLYDTGI